MTPIDIAFSEMEADESNDNARLRFYERLIDCELFMLLEAESDGQSIKPDLFEVENEQVALVFDKEDRLADFSNSIVPLKEGLYYFIIEDNEIEDMIFVGKFQVVK